MSGKYRLLTTYLRTRASHSHGFWLALPDIERVIGCELPNAAYLSGSWWTSRTIAKNRPQAQAWLDAGYEIDDVKEDEGASAVHFRKVSPGPQTAAKKRARQEIADEVAA